MARPEDGVGGVVAAAAIEAHNGVLDVRASSAGAAADQSDLFEPVLVPRLAEDAGHFAARRAAAVDRMRKAGRPAGAQNLMTRQVKELALRYGPHPMVSLMRIAAMDITSLAEELGCSRLEAFDRQTAISRELLGYFVGKAAPTDAQGNAVPFFNFQIGGGPAGPDGSPGAPFGGLKPWEWAQGQYEQNQSLSLDADAVSQSHMTDEGK